MKTSADVAVVGGGVIGLALARELSSRGADVVVVERGRTGEEASSAAAGLLSAQSDAESPSPFFELARRSRDLYPDWSSALREETGIDVGWRRTGVLRCGTLESLERFAWQLDAGLPLERLQPPEIARLSAGRAARELSHGLFFPEDAAVDNRQLVRALRSSLDRRGVAVLEGVPVTRFLLEAGGCRGVETPAGPIRADRVVDSAGAWANFDAMLSRASLEWKDPRRCDRRESRVPQGGNRRRRRPSARRGARARAHARARADERCLVRAAARDAGRSPASRRVSRLRTLSRCGTLPKRSSAGAPDGASYRRRARGSRLGRPVSVLAGALHRSRPRRVERSFSDRIATNDRRPGISDRGRRRTEGRAATKPRRQ